MDYRAYAPIYDAEYRDYTEDIAYYTRWAKRCGPPALELGCGTGRVLLGLAEAGCPVWGLDNCTEMLEQARQKVREREPKGEVRLFEGDMRDFDLQQEFGLIYLPFREFMHLHTETHQLDCLDSIHRHLRPDGRVIINLYDIDLVALAGQDPHNVPLMRQSGGDYTDMKTGRKVVCSSASFYFHHNQTLREERFYDTIGADGRVVERRAVLLTQRWFFRWEMHHLLHRANFRVESVVGGYQNQTPGRPGGELIFVARPANAEELAHELEWIENKLLKARGQQ